MLRCPFMFRLWFLAVIASPSAHPFDPAAYELIDLTHPFNADTVYWPTAPGNFDLERLNYGYTEAGFFYAANAFSTPEHGGTHLDAPIHFFAGRRTADEVPLRQLVAPGVVIDVSTQAALDRNYRLTIEDVLDFEKRHGVIPAGTAVVLRCGWSRHWPEKKAYLGDDTPGDASRLQFPSFGAEAARVLIAERGVALIGVDTASIDYGRSTDFPVHRIAAERNVPGLENLANLDKLPATGFTLIALPMKIEGGSGAPVRVIALLRRE